jgi:O-antigen/teichoic acid export membrane protein
VSTLQLLTRNISWRYVEAGVKLVVYFFLTPFVIEHLGTTGFGLWVLLNAILFYLRFLDFGFYNALVKYFAEYSSRGRWRLVNGLIGTTASVLLLAGSAALLLSAVVAFLLLPHAFDVPAEHLREVQFATVLLGLDLLFAFPAAVLRAVLEGAQRFDALARVSIGVTLAGAAATAVTLSTGYGILALVTIEIAGTFVTAALHWSCVRRHVPQARVAPGRLGGRFFRRIRGYSTWTSLNEVLAEGSAEVEKLLVPIFLGISLLTPYTLICTVAAVIFLAIEPVTDVLFPLSAAYDANGNRERLRDVLVRGTKIVMAISLPLAVAVGAYGEAFIVAWVGAEHVSIPANVLPMVVASFAVTAFVLTCTTILLALGKAREVFWMGIAELGIAVALLIASVPRFELQGLAGSLLVSNLLVSFLWIVPATCRALEQGLSGFLTASLLRPALAALPMALAIPFLDAQLPAMSLLWLAAKATIAGMIFLGCFYAISLTSGERLLCRDGARRLLGRAAG